MQTEIKIIVYNPTTDDANFVADVYIDGERTFFGKGGQTKLEAIREAGAWVTNYGTVPKDATALHVQDCNFCNGPVDQKNALLLCRCCGAYGTTDTCELKRQLVDADLEANQQQLKGLLDENYTFVELETKQKLANDLALFTDPTGSYRFVRYFRGNAVCGMQVMYKPGMRPVLANVYTHEHYRKRGFATALFEIVKRRFPDVRYSLDRSHLGELLYQSLKAKGLTD